MSTPRYSLPRPRDYSKQLETFKNNFIPWIFHDHVGLGIFLGALLFYGMYWRIGFFITDNWTLANTLAGLSNGHLHVDELVYGPYDGNTPGMNVVNDQLYGRNYGQLVLSLPLVWFIELTTHLADFRLLLAGLYSLVLLAFFRTIGHLRAQPSIYAIIGGLSALGAFTVNIWFATPLAPMWTHQVALQLTTLIAASYLGVIAYRLGTHTHSQHTGVFLAVMILIATPIGFWASIPKRHIFTSLLALTALYATAISRTTRTAFPSVYYRAIAYSTIGLTAWIHAAEALVLLLVLVPIDLATAPRNTRRDLAIIAIAFGVSLIPFFLTNYLVVGNPLEPPRLWPRYDGQPLDTTPPSPEPPSTPSTGNSVLTVPGLLLSLAASIPSYLGRFVDFVTAGLTLTVTEPHRLYFTFIRSGWIEGVTIHDEGAMNLTVLESAPIIGVLLSLPVLLQQHSPRLTHLAKISPRQSTDLFAASYIVVFTLMYLPRLPLHAMVTVRYLLPIFPFLCYAVSRLPVTRDVITNSPKLLAWTYLGLVLIGSQLLLVILFTLDLNPEEAMQLHAHLGLAVALLVGGWATGSTLKNTSYPRIGAVMLAFALATGTIFLLFTGFDYTTYGNFALAIGELLDRLITIT